MKKLCTLLVLSCLLYGCSSGQSNVPSEIISVILVSDDFNNPDDSDASDDFNNPDDLEITETISEPEDFSVTETEPFTAEPEYRFSPEKIASALADTAELTQHMQFLSEKHYAVGMSIAVFVNGEVIYTFNSGYADKEAGILVSNETKYRCASVSKTATAVCAMILAERGKLDLDAPISGIIGINMDNHTGVLNTTRHLLTHTSNITSGLFYNIALMYNPPLSLAQLSEEGFCSDVLPGSRYFYSNFGASLIAAVAESVTGERFYDFAYENLFTPLGMDAGYMRTFIKDSENIANVYEGGVLNKEVKTWGRTPAFYSQIPLGQAYGYAECELIISASDLAKLGIILSGDGSYNGVYILNQQSVDEMNRIYISGGESSYGLGLRMNENVIEGRTITGHAGQALGMVGGLYFDASDGTGVAILTNGCSVTSRANGMYGINDDMVKTVYDWFFD
ncbi:MAG: beta-lactamase family protein [Oscillospiraceae bacterium]|nr:beta-lactamase family protein [Oscillospiraceae bacterium]